MCVFVFIVPVIIMWLPRGTMNRNCNDCVGVQKGDRVAVYMPMILEMVVTLLACARLGVIHSVVVSISRSINLSTKASSSH